MPDDSASEPGGEAGPGGPLLVSGCVSSDAGDLLIRCARERESPDPQEWSVPEAERVAATGWMALAEQRFEIRAHGDTRREIVEFDGLKLIRVPANGD